MLLFHGTTDEHRSSIVRDGLRPPDPTDRRAERSWQRVLTGWGPGAHVYLSTRPVAGKGGDPVSFAMDWGGQVMRGRRRALPGHIVVVDLPPEQHHRVRTAIRNLEIDRLHERLMLEHHLSTAHELRALIALARIDPEPLIATPIATGVNDSIRDDLDPWTWIAFIDAYLHLVTVQIADLDDETLHRKRRALLDRYALRLPDWMEADRIDWRLPFTVQSLYHYVWRIEGVPTTEQTTDRSGARVGYHFSHVLRSFDRMVIGQLPWLKGLMGAFLAAHPADAIDDWLAHAPFRTGFSALRRRFPPDESRLPLVWQEAFFRRDHRPLWREPDVQLLCDAIPAEHILGTIPLSENRRLRPALRPNRRRGETLERKLWAAALALKRS
ncbi:MAG: hypothetical protein AAFV53_04330 [Myxococcota bacterium]